MAKDFSRQGGRGQGYRHPPKGSSHAGGPPSRSSSPPAAPIVQPATPCEPPYHFVPARPSLAVLDDPVFHDVQQIGDDFWSGELRCTLTALTPLLAGNFQFDYEHLDSPLKQEFQRLLQQVGNPAPQLRKKNVLEPLRLRETVNGVEKPVVITGEAIKGAIRNPLQALLSAPMERVQERTFSFRPNLMDAENVRPAIVHSRKLDSKRELVELEVQFAGTCNDVIYVFDNAVPKLADWVRKNVGGAPRSLDLLPARDPCATIRGTVAGVHLDIRRFGPVEVKKLERADSQSELLQDYLLARYREGLDGTSTFKKAFNNRSGYTFALVKNANRRIERVPDQVLAQFLRTVEHVGDRKKGHLLSHPLSRDGKLNAVPGNVSRCPDEWPQVGDLLFVEVVDNQIVGIGHHFRHRRLYRDSIHLAGDPKQLAKDRLRSILCPPKLERDKQSDGAYGGAPRKLTAARGMFGYVAQTGDEYDEEKPNEAMTFGIGAAESDFKQLAGRVSINWAIEQPRNEGDRFLHENDGECLVPLRPLGEPKPSAVETYLTQDKLGKRNDAGTLCTYGDTIDDLAAGELNGRKFYLHQPDARDPQKQHYELRPGSPDWSQTDKQGRTTYHIVGDQAMLARFVSAPGTQFKFALRFRDLRAWELGALLFVLAADQPLIEKLVDELGLAERPPRLRQWLDQVSQNWKPANPDRPLLALKLGHGRPLGLGSVRIEVDGIARLRFDADMLPRLGDTEQTTETVAVVRQQLVAALAAKLKSDLNAQQLYDWTEQVLLPWLQVHRYAGRSHFDYRRDTARKPNDQPTKYPPEPETIYSYHTNQRRKHAMGRKFKPGTQRPKAGGLTTLDELDRQGR